MLYFLTFSSVQNLYYKYGIQSSIYRLNKKITENWLKKISITNVKIF